MLPRLVAYALIGLSAAWYPRLDAHASCNLIPGTKKDFPSHLGSVNRPFASPGESFEIRLRGCDTDSTGFLPSGDDHVATLVFKPVGGPKRAVVLTDDCTDITAQIAACGAANPGLPIACKSGDAFLETRIDVDDGDRRLVVTMPGTDAEFPPDLDGATLTGPVAVAVTPKGQALPCALAGSNCAAHDGTIACVDEIFLDDGDCGTDIPNTTFSSFTALPPPNDFQAACFQEAKYCTGTAQEVRGAVDRDGNLLLPMAWQGVLVSDSTTPIARLVRTRLLSPLPLTLPDQVFLGSYSPEGGRLPPILEPQLDPSVAAPDVVTMFGSIDAPYTIIRVARRHGTCSSGTEAGHRCERDGDCKGGLCLTSCVADPATACEHDDDCSSGSCGSLFDFSPFASVGGPVLMPRSSGDGFCQLAPHAACDSGADCPGPGDACVNYAMEAQTPVPLEGLAASDTTRAFTIKESVDGVDRNGDGDTDDDVVTLRDRVSGVSEALGAPENCDIGGTPEGRSVVRVHEPPFSFPAVAVRGDVVAFLESEPGENACDSSGDHDVADSILRIFRLGAGETTIATPPRAVDAAPRIDRKPLAVSGGRVFVRTSEEAMAMHQTVRANLGAGDQQATSSLADLGLNIPLLTRNGNEVAFASFGLPGLESCEGEVCNWEVYIRDLVPPGATERVLPGHDGAPLDVGLTGTMNLDDLSPDGRYVVFHSNDPRYFGPGNVANAVVDVILRDRCKVDRVAVPGCTPSYERISVASDMTEADNDSSGGRISDDGRFVAFWSYATNLVAPATSRAQVFVRDRCQSNGVAVPGCTPHTEVVSVGPQGLADKRSLFPEISSDGMQVIFKSDATNLSPEYPQGGYFIRDRSAGLTSRLFDSSFPPSVDPAGFSEDFGRIAFTDGMDVYVLDRSNSTIVRASVSSNGTPGDAYSRFDHNRKLTGDGRRVVFASCASNLVAGDPSCEELYLHDLYTGITEAVSVDATGNYGNSPLHFPFTISRDGTTVVWLDLSSNLLAGDTDTNLLNDIFVRRLDPADPLGVDALLADNDTLGDTVLEIVDATTGAVSTLCPAGDVATAAGNAAFLRQESTAGTPACPAGSLNGDGDTADEVVHVALAGGPAQNLCKAATAIDISDSVLAALVSEAGQNHSDLNGDGDDDDDVLHVHPVSAGCQNWTKALGSAPSVGQAAAAMEVVGSIVAFATPEAAQGHGPLNGDGDTSDDVMQVYDAAGTKLRNVGQAVGSFVLGEPADTACGTLQLLAFETGEASQGDGPLNGDGDTAESVLQVYRVQDDELFQTGQAVTPCQLVACDPTRPFRISGASVRFLTQESEQGKDLDGNGSVGGLVLQNYDACTNVVSVLGPVNPDDGSANDPLEVIDDSHVFAAPGGRCAVDPAIECSGQPGDCPEGSYCDPSSLLCSFNAPGACVHDGDCPPSSACVEASVVAAIGIADFDDDGVTDELDNCSRSPNPLQHDTDEDDVGDVCDVVSGGFCGDGIVDGSGTEHCDDGDTSFTPGQPCNAACQRVACGKPTDSTGILPKSSDALHVLKSAVGTATCDLSVCDVNSSGTRTATDALLVLKKAVGQPVALSCPAPPA